MVPSVDRVILLRSQLLFYLLGDLEEIALRILCRVTVKERKLFERSEFFLSQWIGVKFSEFFHRPDFLFRFSSGKMKGKLLSSTWLLLGQRFFANATFCALFKCYELELCLFSTSLQMLFWNYQFPATSQFSPQAGWAFPFCIGQKVNKNPSDLQTRSAQTVELTLNSYLLWYNKSICLMLIEFPSIIPSYRVK